mmetsp:Transcript_11084/g.36861  ORF Transcript_11084/g.36861 Transcript_11084/m.36861 type:complete len:120 (+) Transcript_11084:369-728(+)
MVATAATAEQWEGLSARGRPGPASRRQAARARLTAAVETVGAAARVAVTGWAARVAVARLTAAAAAQWDERPTWAGGTAEKVGPLALRRRCLCKPKGLLLVLWFRRAAIQISPRWAGSE